MGSAVSKNITRAVTQTIANVSNTLISTTKLSADQTQIISVTEVGGDVVISENALTQKVNLNIKALLHALMKENVQQNLTLQIAQACKSIVSGLNIFQFPNAQNEIDLFLKASIELVNTVNQSCLASFSQNQTIVISKVKHNVYINKNTMSQIAGIFHSCVQKSVLENTVFQQLQEKIDQNATAEAKGLNLWDIAILIAIVCGSVIGGRARSVWLVAVVAGAACLTAYYARVEESVCSHAFSGLIKNLPNCNASLISNSNAYSNSTAAAQACASNTNCVAFDWQGSAIDRSGNSSPLKTPQSFFYSSISSGCEKAVTSFHDNSKILRVPVFTKGFGSPINAEGDAYLDVATACYYFFDQETKIWVKQGSFVPKSRAEDPITTRPEVTDALKARSFKSIDWGSTLTAGGVVGSIYVRYDLENPIYFYVYVRKPNGWKRRHKLIKGPGLIPNAPDNINVTGFTTLKRKRWLLNMGGALLLVGILGSLF